MTEQTVIIPHVAGDLATAGAVALAGQAADEAAARSAFADYRSRKAENTIRRQDAGLSHFARYLGLATRGNAPSGAALATDPEAWRGVTWGLVERFRNGLLLEGYAVATINVRLGTVKRYAQLAMKAGVLDAQVLTRIREVDGYSRKEGKEEDKKRTAAGIPTRSGGKKAEPVSLTPAQAEALKDRPDTPQGRRDRLLMCLFLEHGLRAGEVAGLTVGDVDLKAGELRFYREKVDKNQTHRLTPPTLKVARAYLEHDAPALGPLLRGSRKGGELTTAGMTARAITARVRYLGKGLGIEDLSAHDLRHYWATRAARSGTPLDRLKDAGGWASYAMPLRYIKDAKIANEGVRLEGAPAGAGGLVGGRERFA